MYYAVGPGTYWDKNYTRAILYYYTQTRAGPRLWEETTTTVRGVRGGGGGPTNAHYTGAARGHCTLLLYY